MVLFIAFENRNFEIIKPMRHVRSLSVPNEKIIIIILKSDLHPTRHQRFPVKHASERNYRTRAGLSNPSLTLSLFTASQSRGQLVLGGVPLQDRREPHLPDHLRGSRTVRDRDRVLPPRVAGVHRVPRPVRVLRRPVHLHATENG